MTDLFEPLTLQRGPAWKNRFTLAPLTNSQSHADGKLSDDEFNWLTYRAEGGFGLVAMRQRIEGVSGTLEIESEPGAGTAISACLPAAPAGSQA